MNCCLRVSRLRLEGTQAEAAVGVLSPHSLRVGKKWWGRKSDNSKTPKIFPTYSEFLKGRAQKNQEKNKGEIFRSFVLRGCGVAAGELVRLR